MTSKHIITKVSFKITIRERHFYIDIRWLWIWNQYLYIWIWNDDRSTIIVLPSFQLVTRLNSQNRNENVFINELCHINLFMNIIISNWHNWSFDPTKIEFFNLFHSLQDYWPPNTWNPLVHTSWGNCRNVKNVLFSSPKWERKKIKWNIKPGA